MDNNAPRKERSFLVTLSAEVADSLEDMKYYLQRREQRRITKRSLVETAIKKLVASLGQ